MTGLRLADLRRNARRLETIAEMTERLTKLEAVISSLAARVQRLEAAAKLSTRVDNSNGETEYEVSSLIG